MGKSMVEIIEQIVKSQYSPEERAEFSNTIKKFVKLYYDMQKQTWNATQWRGVNVHKAATDLWIYQELIHAIKPDCIIETGSMHGGSALFMHDICTINDLGTHIISIDIEDRSIHKIAKKAPIYFLNGSSVDPDTITTIKAWIHSYNLKKIMVVLDSDHSTEHVLQEMNLYAQFVSVGSILIVEDTYPCVDLVPMITDWLVSHPEFERDYMCEKFMLTFNRDGYLERVK